jgi:hypothetical protein
VGGSFFFFFFFFFGFRCRDGRKESGNDADDNRSKLRLEPAAEEKEEDLALHLAQIKARRANKPINANLLLIFFVPGGCGTHPLTDVYVVRRSTRALANTYINMSVVDTGRGAHVYTEKTAAARKNFRLGFPGRVRSKTATPVAKRRGGKTCSGGGGLAGRPALLLLLRTRAGAKKVYVQQRWLTA